MSKGIDVAKYQGTINWTKVKNAGVEYAIIKCLEKANNKEPNFETNFNGTLANKIEQHVYDYVYCQTVAEFTSRANTVISCLGGRKLDGYVWIDVEDKCLMTLGKVLIDGMLAYQKVIESKGYKFGIYTGLSFYNSYLKSYSSSFANVPFWIARYPYTKQYSITDVPQADKKPSISNTLMMWQYTSNGRVDGINGAVDMNIRYVETTNTNETIKVGSKGDLVGEAQTLLKNKGYTITVDKIFGSGTKAVVEQFQYDNDLTKDGVVGANTWKKLRDDSIVKPTTSGIQTFSKAKNGNTYLSANFKVSEFACKDGSDTILIDVDFVKNYLQKIRDHFGVSVTINSAYRNETYNTKIGGAKNSYHIKGQAFDITVKGKTPNQVAKYAQTLGIKGIIQYNTFTHIDSRSTKYWARNNNGAISTITNF